MLEDFEIEHSALGWERIQPYGSIPFAIETSQGAAVEQLLEAGMQVYPLNLESAQSYRQRKAPSGVKDDRLDAWSFADACRVDGHGWKALRREGGLSLAAISLRSPLLQSPGLPSGDWVYEMKVDGYRAWRCAAAAKREPYRETKRTWVADFPKAKDSFAAIIQDVIIER